MARTTSQQLVQLHWSERVQTLIELLQLRAWPHYAVGLAAGLMTDTMYEMQKIQPMTVT